MLVTATDYEQAPTVSVHKERSVNASEIQSESQGAVSAITTNPKKAAALVAAQQTRLKGTS